MTDNRADTSCRPSRHPTRRDIVAGGAMLPVAMGIPAGAAAQPPAAVTNSAMVLVNLTINGRLHTLSLDPRTTLLDLMREHLDLTGTKKGCDQGQCGACTVLMDGRRINSCLTFAVMCDGAQITTIEGLATHGALHPLQQAFIDHDAFQWFPPSNRTVSESNKGSRNRSSIKSDSISLVPGPRSAGHRPGRWD